MGKIDSVVETIKGELYDLQTALDNSALSEEYGVCYPIEEWIKVILAAYSVNTKSQDNSNNDNNDSNDSNESSEEWLQDSYWKERILSEADKKDKQLGYTPNNCDFWNPSIDVQGIYGVETDPFYVEKVSACLNEGKKSFKGFNAIHFSDGDPNFTLGFQHLAGGSEQSFFVYLTAKENANIYEEMCKYIVYRFKNAKDANSATYRLQFANDPIIKKQFFKSEKEQVSSEKIDAWDSEKWMTAVKFFFSTAGVLKKEQKINNVAGHEESALANWIEDLMVEYVTHPIGDFKHIVVNNITIAKLVQEAENPDGFTTGFWFHDIMKDAFLLKSIAAAQIKNWEKKYYIPAIKKLKTLLKSELDEKTITNRINQHEDIIVSGVLSLAGWVNSRPAVQFYPNKNDSGNLSLYAEWEDKGVEYKYGPFELTSNQYRKGNTSEDIVCAKILLTVFLYRDFAKRTRGRTRYILSNYLSTIWVINTSDIKVDDYKKVKRK